MTAFDIIVQITNGLLNTLITFVFFKAFWKLKYRTHTTAILFAVSALILSVPMVFFKGSIIALCALFVATFILAFAVKSSILNKLAFTGLLLALMSIIENLVAFMLSVLFGAELSALKEGIAFATGMLLSKCLVYAVIHFAQTVKHKPLLGQLSIKYLGVLLFPLASSIVMIVQQSVFVSAPQQGAVVSYAVLFGDTLLLIANALMFDIIDTLHDRAMYDSRMLTADKVIEAQKAQYNALIENTRSVMKVRHDHKNFCIGLVSELKSGRVENAITLLRREYADNCPEKEKISGDILHTVIDIKTREAKDKGITLDYEYRELKKMTVSSIDMAVILGNALDNAIEAAEEVTTEPRQIGVYIASRNNTVMINIKNPTERDVDVGNLVTTKPDTEKHGFGIVGMRQLVEKYGGELLFKCEERVFTTTIVLTNVIEE